MLTTLEYGALALAQSALWEALHGHADADYMREACGACFKAVQVADERDGGRSADDDDNPCGSCTAADLVHKL